MKKFIKFVEKVIGNFWLQLLILIGFAIAILAIGGTFDSKENAQEKTLELVAGTDMLSIFLAAAISLIVARVAIRIKHTMEESLKLEDDHHKIISKYYKHISPADHTENAYTPCGEFMQLRCVPATRHRPHNMVEDSYSDEYPRRTKDINDYTDYGRLYISGVNIFANIKGDTDIVFNDKTDMFELPPFVMENLPALLGAHGGSSIRNSVTVRLNDAEYADSVLRLSTQRSMYYHMLVTNRCMDYKINDRMTVREVYEFDKRVSPLAESKLGNQIGINGLVFTNDGYVLIEKRGKHKTTWKDKFAQPISLALKAASFVPEGGTIAETAQAADEAFKKIILDTVYDNYGLTEKELNPFSVRHNFLGLARDLIEGGKPNLYFFVVARMSAEELRVRLREKAIHAAELNKAELQKQKKLPKTVETPKPYPATNKEEKEKKIRPLLTDAKIDGDLYLVRLEDLRVDFGYNIALDPRKIMCIERRCYPRVNKLRQSLDRLGHNARCGINRPWVKECGEALLACLYYADICNARLSEEIGISKR